MSKMSDHNPFVGPRPIQQGEPLYGRTAEVMELFHRLQARRIVVLHSPSGAGKSSLVQAGLTPKLADSGFDVWKPIRVNLDPSGLPGIPPGTNRYLLSALVSLEEELPAERRRTPAELAGLDLRSYLETRPRRKSQAERSVVLLFDQFEEVLTVAPREVAEKQAFFDEVGQALDTGKYWALLIVREDYLAAFAPYRERIPTQMSNTFRLDLLGLQGAREVAEGLARKGGRSFPAVDKLIENLSLVQVQKPDGSFREERGIYVEPVHLQVVCRQLWDEMPEDDLSIKEQDIASYADVTRALGGYYAQAVQKMAGGERAVERAVREWVGSKLIVGGIRSQVRREPGQSAGLDNGLIDKLCGCYLVRTEQRAGADWFELGHDRLVSPIQKDNAAWFSANLHPLQVQAKLWESGQRKEAQLLGVEALAEALLWAGQNPALLTATERDFLEQSRTLREAEAARRRVQRLFMTALAAVAIAATTLGVWAWHAQREAQTALLRARDAVWMSYVRTFAEKDPTRTVLGLREVAAPEQTVGWLQATMDSYQRPLAQARLVGHHGSVLTAAFSPDGLRVVTASYDGTARLWRADGTGAPVVMTGHHGPVRSAAFSPDGTHIITASEDGTARLWRGDGSATPVLFKSPDQQRGLVSAVFDPSGQQVVTRSSFDHHGLLWMVSGIAGPVDLGRQVQAVSWNASGTQLLVTDADGLAEVRSSSGAGAAIRLGVHVEWCSPDGQHVLISPWHGPMRVLKSKWKGFPSATGDLQGGVLKDSAGIWNANFSVDGKQVIADASDGSGRWVWNADGSGERRFVRFLDRDSDGDRMEAPDDTCPEDSCGMKWAPFFAPSPGWEASANRRGVPSKLGRGGEQQLHGTTTDPFYVASFSPDGKRVVTVQNGRARIWNADGTGAPRTLFRTNLGGAVIEKVLSASFSADGKQVRTYSAGDPEGLRPVANYDVETGDEEWRGILVPAPLSLVSGTAVRREGTEAFIGPPDRMVKITKLLGHDDEVLWAARSLDGSRLVTASKDHTARVWKLGESAFPGEVIEQSAAVKWASFGGRGTNQKIATVTEGHEGHEVAIYYPRSANGTERTIRTIAAGNYLCSASFDPQGQRMALGSLGDLRSSLVAGTSASIFFLDDSGRPLLSLAGKVDAGQKPEPPPHSFMVQNYVLWALFSPNGERVLTSTWHETQPKLTLWHADGSGIPIDWVGHQKVVTSAAWSADGQRVVTASEDKTARVWTVDGSHPPIELKGHSEAVRSAAFSPDGRQVVTASNDKTARLWTLDKHPSFVELKGHEDKVYLAAFGPDGKHVLTASDDGSARIWNRLGQSHKTLEEDKDLVYWAAWSPDGTQVVTAMYSGRVLIWNLAEGNGSRVTLQRHRGPANWAAWSPDGKHLLTASDDKTARLWILDGLKLKGLLGAASSACVSEEERTQYLGDSPQEACAAFGRCEVAHGRPAPVCQARVHARE